MTTSKKRNPSGPTGGAAPSALCTFVLCLLVSCAAGVFTGGDDPTTSAPVTDSAPTQVSASTTPSPAPSSTQKPSTKAPAAGNRTACPVGCQCPDTRLICESLGWTTLPNLKELSKGQPFSEISFRNNSLAEFSFNFTVNSLTSVDLSDNLLKSISAIKKQSEFPKLQQLDLHSNKLDSLAGLTKLNFPALLRLDLGDNELTDLQPTDFKSMGKLAELTLDDNDKLKQPLNETLFSQLAGLTRLSLRDMGLSQLSENIFAKNSRLSSVDLSRNEFVEVPTALRRLNATLAELRLNSNQLTSLRPSDFHQLTGLTTIEVSNNTQLRRIEDDTFGRLASANVDLISVTNNPRLEYVSPNAFRSDAPTIKVIVKLDLSYNNLATLASPSQWASATFKQLVLDNNPWNCQCDLKWLLAADPRAHCKAPELYRDMEVRLFFQTVDCEPEDPLGYQRLVLALFLVFLLLLTVAVFVQKYDICRRLQWREQYGTIYYTKASFPATEQA